MSAKFDTVIRGGTIIDGSGAKRFEGDVAIRDGRIAAVGTFEGRGAEEIDARGRLVTPGFVDVHTHYDGQVTWENRLAPSSSHGVTTVVMGNCGVGFAPVRESDRELLIKVMEGVEDIPELVMAEGIPWNWESFPEYLDVLSERVFDIDIGAQVPHSPVRVYVMGDRGAAHYASTEADRARMTQIVAEAIRAGALGVSTSRSTGHRLKSGELAPSVSTEEKELVALAAGLKDAQAGVFQLVTSSEAEPEDEMSLIRDLATTAGRPVSFTLLQAPHHRFPNRWRDMLVGVARANEQGLEIRGQVFPRPVGVLLGLDLSLNPFSNKPSYQSIADLPLAERVAAMRDPALKARILAEEIVPDNQPLVNMMIGSVDRMFVLNDPVDYAPPADQQLSARAAAAEMSLNSYVYDLLLELEGRNILYLPSANFIGCSLDAVREMMADKNTVLGLGDGGAHYGFICDASYPTFMLTHWVRDAADDQRFELEWAISQLSKIPAECVGLSDRGQIAPELRADINIIDLGGLRLYAPRPIYDLPAGGRRLQQRADGYDATIVNGVVTYRGGISTGAMPGRLVRGPGYLAS